MMTLKEVFEFLLELMHFHLVREVLYFNGKLKESLAVFPESAVRFAVLRYVAGVKEADKLKVLGYPIF